MERSVVFETPGEMDIRSFTAFGVNAKPMSTSPLGYFGTGLKYAIAVLVREGMQIYVTIGTKTYTFYRKNEKFRDKSFDFVRMRRETWLPSVLQWGKSRYEELPFTTELGKNWQLWQAFRELYTNTLDEKGETFVVEDLREGHNNPPRSGVTRIVVTGEAFVTEFFDRDKNFLPDGLRQREGTERLQVFDRPSNHIYYRGMRVFDLDKPSTLTYNFLCEVDLTEDRTAASPFKLQDEISKYILACEERERIEKVLSNRDSYESNINYQWAYRAPGPAFREAALAAPGNPTATALVRQYEPRKLVENPLAGWPRPWQLHPVEGEEGSYIVLDSHLKRVMEFQSSLSTEAIRYMVALLEKDLPDEEFDAWLRERPADLVLTDPDEEEEIREAVGPVLDPLDDGVPF